MYLNKSNPILGFFANRASRSDREDLIPKCPYYELPAGMMIPLILPEDCTFKPLFEKDLRIPAPDPPSERLLMEVERFFDMHINPDNPRDNDGWEVKGLLQYYVKKAEHRVKLQEELKKEGKCFEDAITNRYVPPPKESTPEKNNSISPKERRSRSQSSSSSSNSSDDTSSSSDDSSPARKRSQSRSLSPKRRRINRSISPEERPSFGGSAFTNNSAFGNPIRR